MYYLLKWIKFSVKKKQNIKNTTEKIEKSTEKVREFCWSRKVGTLSEVLELQVGKSSTIV